MIKRKKPLKKISDKRLEELGGKMPYSTIQCGKRTPIKRMSERTKISRNEYGELRKQYLKTHPYCELAQSIREYRDNGGNALWWPVCTKKAVEIHHMAGRLGKNLTDISRFKAACCSMKNTVSCHRWVTEHSAQAIEIGLSVSRLT